MEREKGKGTRAGEGAGAAEARTWSSLRLRLLISSLRKPRFPNIAFGTPTTITVTTTRVIQIIITETKEGNDSARPGGWGAFS